jgi:hypothetical protein
MYTMGVLDAAARERRENPPFTGESKKDATRAAAGKPGLHILNDCFCINCVDLERLENVKISYFSQSNRKWQSMLIYESALLLLCCIL